MPEIAVDAKVCEHGYVILVSRRCDGFCVCCGRIDCECRPGQQTILIPLERDGEQYLQCEHGVTLGIVDACPECYRMSEIIADGIVFWDTSRQRAAEGKSRKRTPKSEQEELDLKIPVDEKAEV